VEILLEFTGLAVVTAARFWHRLVLFPAPGRADGVRGRV